ncbi:hypothetical protein RJ639_013903 [Escallonia herrerae]|uniref:Uncharacterized protein n=1 Tax=Escallonia herrerae TaxID=1293975 RepID=A0AA88VGY3_9ASTE|nr:hypothetical protein RJ639_013903 [Escallonia herrerae]
MPGQKMNVEGRNGGKCKIRKRGCSSSSSSSMVKNYRLKRAILAGKRGGSSTPVPTWKMGTRSPSMENNQSVKYFPKKGMGKGKEISMSARKLGATLWEMNEFTSPRARENLVEDESSEVEMGSKGRVVKSSKSGSVESPLPDPSHSLVLKGAHSSWIYSLSPNSADLSMTMQVEFQTRGQTLSRHVVGVKTRLKDISKGLTTSKELLKVLNRVWVPEEHHSTSKSLVSALKIELDQARILVEMLIQEERSNRDQIVHYLLKQFAEERAAWKQKEQYRIHNAITSIAKDLDVEKKLRRQTERLNKKLGKELENTRASMSKAVEELESEKRAREILEQVCDELARGIGEDRAAVEELKKESAKVREEVEKEREMLQIADVLREERVQMKLSEAKYQFEEKNAAVEMLKSELEAYLTSKRCEGKRDHCSPNYDKIKELEDYLRKTLMRSSQNGESKKDERETGERGEDDSADSDLHSIELNMDNNRKSCEWSYIDSNRTSVDDIIMGKKLTYENGEGEHIYLEREVSDSIEWEFSNKHQEDSDEFVRERFSKIVSQAREKDYEDEIERTGSDAGSSLKAWLRGDQLKGCTKEKEIDYGLLPMGLNNA